MTSPLSQPTARWAPLGQKQTLKTPIEAAETADTCSDSVTTVTHAVTV